MTSRQRYGILSAVSAVASILSVSGAHGQPTSIRYHEFLTDLEFVSNDDSADSSRGAAVAASMSFYAFGQQFDIELQSNRRIMPRAPRALLRPGTRLGIYRGRIRNLPDSWVRITKYRDAVYGAIWDGYELYAIEPQSGTSGEIADGAPSSLVIYRLSDTRGYYSDLLVYPAESPEAAEVDESGGETIPQILAAAISPARELSIGVVGDSEFVRSFTDSPEPWILGVINIVDGIFLWQVGLQITIGELQLLDDDSDPFTDFTPTGLLTELSSYRVGSQDLLAHGLTHLLTGRDMEGESIGIANLGVLCSVANGVSVTQIGRGQVTDALTVAHEIAHNLGAPHDAEAESPCADAPAQLMAPRLNGSQEFSQCSIDQMTPEISSATCLSNIPANDVSITLASAPLTVDAGERFTVDLDIEASGPDPAVALEVTLGRGALEQIAFPASPWACTELPEVIRCRLNNLEANSVSRLSVEMAQPERVDFSIPIELASVNDPSISNNSLTVDIGRTPSVDLLVSHDRDEVVMRYQEQSEIVATIRNRGVSTADRIEFTVSRQDDLRFVSLEPSSGECEELTDAGFRFECVLGELPADDFHTIRIVFQAGESPDAEPDEDVWTRENIFTDAIGIIGGEPEDREGGSTEVIVSERIVELNYEAEVPVSARADESVVVTGRLINSGPDEATRATLSIAFDQRSIEISRVESSAGECNFDNVFKDVACTVDELLPGATLEVRAFGSYAENTTDAVRVYVSSREWNLSQEIRPGTTALQFSVGESLSPNPPPLAVNTNPSPSTSGGGGGGAMNPGSLFLLGLFALVLRRPREYRTLFGHSVSQYR